MCSTFVVDLRGDVILSIIKKQIIYEKIKNFYAICDGSSDDKC